MRFLFFVINLWSKSGLFDRTSGKSSSYFKKTQLEVISTGYILLESGTETAVERVSKTKLQRNNLI
jgi:heptaprenylglyceryl phosphate synthase